MMTPHAPPPIDGGRPKFRMPDIYIVLVLFILAGISLIVLGIVQIIRAIRFGHGIATP